MPNIQIKDVPPETHAVLTRRAAEAGQSLHGGGADTQATRRPASRRA